MLSELKKSEVQLAGQAKFRLSEYRDWLDSQSFSVHTKCNYFSQVKQFLSFLQKSILSSDAKESDPISLVQDYRRYLLDSVKALPGSVNKSLTAIDNFYRFLGIAPAHVKREKLSTTIPRVLTPEEQTELLKTLARQNSKKDQAVMTLFLYTGIRLSECAALNISDVQITSNSGTIIVRTQKEKERHIPLNSLTAAALGEWLRERKAKSLENGEQALFLNQEGKRISKAGLDLIVRKVGIRAHLVLSAQRLRNTCLANVARSSKDIVAVTRFGGYKRLATARKYLSIDSDHNGA